MQFTFIIFLIALILFRRVKRSIGFQRYNQPTLIIRIVLFSLISLSILAFALVNPKVLLPDGIGILVGLILAYIATNHAQFEKREDGLYYKTHIWVEVAVICLFMARFIYRVVVLHDLFQPDQNQQEVQARMQSIQDPITGSILFAFCAYYIGYFSFIIRESKTQR